MYLIEVNTSPALYRHGQVLTDLLPVLIEEVVQKVRSRPNHTLYGCAENNVYGGAGHCAVHSNVQYLGIYTMPLRL